MCRQGSIAQLFGAESEFLAGYIEQRSLVDYEQLQHDLDLGSPSLSRLDLFRTPGSLSLSSPPRFGCDFAAFFAADRCSFFVRFAVFRM
jgi:hypothetical protein